ncbi:hypothetical protein Tco_0226582 [Tanacetum coccineum]
MYVCFYGYACSYKMVVANVPAENAPALDPPVRSDDQILPYSSWDTIRHDKKTGVYICQLDEQRFELNVDVLKEALGITPRNEANLFVPPIPKNDLIDFVLQLGYPKDISGVSYMYTNDLYLPWRAIFSLINLCFMGKTSGEFIYDIDSFITDKKKLSEPVTDKKNEPKILLIPYVRFTKLIIFYLRSLHLFHPRTGSALHTPDEDCKLRNLKCNTLKSKYAAEC